jgi:hypothetical protein
MTRLGGNCDLTTYYLGEGGRELEGDFRPPFNLLTSACQRRDVYLSLTRNRARRVAPPLVGQRGRLTWSVLRYDVGHTNQHCKALTLV